MNAAGWLHRVQYYETDQMGIVHHSNTIRWFEEARTAYMEDHGFGYAQMEAQGVLSPVLSVACTYKQPVRFGQTVRIIARIVDYNGVRMKVAYRVEDLSGTLHAQGESTHCFLNAQTRFPARLMKSHPDVHALILSWLDAPQE